MTITSPTTSPTTDADDVTIVLPRPGRELEIQIGADGDPDPATGETSEPDASEAPRRSMVVRLATGLLRASGWLVVLVGAALLLVPALLGLDRYVIVGGSMSPTFDKGSVVFSDDVAVTDLAIGDVITYQPPAGTGVTHLVTHRIVEIEPADDGTSVFRTKGDANDSEDPWTFQLVDRRQNVVHFAIPLLGYVLIALSDPQFRMVLVGVPAAFIAAGALAELLGVSLRFPRRHRRAVIDA